MLKQVLPYTARIFGRALIMPNTTPPVVSASDAQQYHRNIISLSPSEFTPLMTFKITAKTTPVMIGELKSAGAIAGKLYPQGVTTNSADGLTDIKQAYPVFAAMQAHNLVLCIHGELPGIFSLDREQAFLPTVQALAKSFPRLRIVLEHISTQQAVETIKQLPKTVAATITVQHLYLTLDDVIGDTLESHHFCKPIAKRPEDREALVKVATSGHPQFFFGSDSAPHPRIQKEAYGAAGIFSAPVALFLLAQLFEQCHAIKNLESFASKNAARFYELPLNSKTITLIKKSWEIPQHYNNIVPFMAGKKVTWQIV